MIKRYSFAMVGVVLALCAVIGVGCNDTTTPPVNITAVNVKQADTTVKQLVTNVQDVGLTLPVLDALFFEDSFQTELKSTLGLTESQVRKLKAAASESVHELSEDGTDYMGSARAAAKNSDDQIKSILGQEKASQLYEFIAKRYSGGDIAGLFPTQPNAVPTDTRIVVNAPAFRMDVFRDGKLQKTYRVGIGYPEFPLPTGMRRASDIIFNPTWTPPDEPWVKGKVKAGKKVAAGSKLNPLGPIKIPIGLPSLIHGGKAVSKLGNFASHGCVGLTNDQVQDFTLLLSQLSGTSLSADSMQQLEQDKTKTRTVKMQKPVLVELRYETIVAENGNLDIYRDVYERGTNTLENARRVLSVYGINYTSLSPQEQQSLTQALDEMNRDAHGDLIAGNPDQASDTTAGNAPNKNNKGVADSKLAGAKKGKVTRSVTGRREIVVPINALQNKGYPAPVNFNTGTQKATVAK